MALLLFSPFPISPLFSCSPLLYFLPAPTSFLLLLLLPPPIHIPSAPSSPDQPFQSHLNVIPNSQIFHLDKYSTPRSQIKADWSKEKSRCATNLRPDQRPVPHQSKRQDSWYAYAYPTHLIHFIWNPVGQATEPLFMSLLFTTFGSLYLWLHRIWHRIRGQRVNVPSQTTSDVETEGYDGMSTTGRF